MPAEAVGSISQIWTQSHIECVGGGALAKMIILASHLLKIVDSRSTNQNTESSFNRVSNKRFKFGMVGRVIPKIRIDVTSIPEKG